MACTIRIYAWRRMEERKKLVGARVRVKRQSKHVMVLQRDHGKLFRVGHF
jgi:hypothetical protein